MKNTYTTYEFKAYDRRNNLLKERFTSNYKDHLYSIIEWIVTKCPNVDVIECMISENSELAFFKSEYVDIFTVWKAED
ncbi:hypothetical protein [Bacillus atrophaeus]|uniref:hypothetical protein n=1 Tax=Bacillus atrophaeus TaxID=1452 RepID=UPI0022820F42|nr:hypothetical protein [Bacillus atrophaeus]MCY8988100.1 hypothetical protein [Bacillus atrophaeus]